MSAAWKWTGMAAAIVGTALSLAAGELKQPMLGEPAPPFRLRGLDGKTLALGGLRGKFVVLHFGAGW